MSDEADRAAQEVERELAEAMRKRRPPGPQPTGRCHYCDELVGEHQRWCSIDCREGWEKEARRGR
jgi:hypothetical protein